MANCLMEKQYYSLRADRMSQLIAATLASGDIIFYLQVK